MDGEGPDRTPVGETCEACGTPLSEYPVLSEGGWYLVVKCRSCLRSVRRERWHPLGHVGLSGAR